DRLADDGDLLGTFAAMRRLDKPAKVVNDKACGLDKRGALESIASRLAPTSLPGAAGKYVRRRAVVRGH
ncbi:hypothetical protein C4E44_19050, partial [Pseudomonas sp. MWU12-2312b]